MTPVEVLAAHSLEWIGHQCTCGEQFQTGKTYRDGMGDLRRMHAAHVLDALTKAGHLLTTAAQIRTVCREARADAWEHGWNDAGHWWHDGEVEGEEPDNPYAAAAAEPTVKETTDE